MDPINVLVFQLAQRLNAPNDGVWVWHLPGGWRLELNTTRFPNNYAEGKTIPPGSCMIYWNGMNVGLVTPGRCDLVLADEDRLRSKLEAAVDCARRDRTDYDDPEVAFRRGSLAYSRTCPITTLEASAKAERDKLPPLTNGRGKPVKMPVPDYVLAGSGGSGKGLMTPIVVPVRKGRKAVKA